MKDRVHLYHALDLLKLPGPDGNVKEFSFEFIAVGGERKGQKLFASRAVVNHFSKQKTAEALKRSEQPSPQAVLRRETYNHKEAGVIAIRILDSPDFPPGTVVTPLKRYITKINDLKTYV